MPSRFTPRVGRLQQYRGAVANAFAENQADPGALRAKLRDHRQAILSIAARIGASNIRVFGSVARGEHREGSDIDLLVDLAPGVTLFDLSRLHRELSELLGVPVDIVSSRALLPRDQDVLDEAIAL